MILYMMRHGETDWNARHLFQGRTDIPLNENGRKVAARTRDGLENVSFDVAFCSPLSRARETAEIVLEGRAIELIEDERIIEMGFGGYEAAHIDSSDENIRDLFAHPELYVDTKGVEPFEAVVARAEDFLHELTSDCQYADKTILIATHGAMLRGLMAAFLDKPVKDFWEGGVHKNCGITIVEIQNGEKRVLKEAITVYDEKDLK